MSGNSFGKNFVVTSFGESHGAAIGCIIDGCPPQVKLTENDIQKEFHMDTFFPSLKFWYFPFKVNKLLAFN